MFQILQYICKAHTLSRKVCSLCAYCTVWCADHCMPSILKHHRCLAHWVCLQIITSEREQLRTNKQVQPHADVWSVGSPIVPYQDNRPLWLVYCRHLCRALCTKPGDQVRSNHLLAFSAERVVLNAATCQNPVRFCLDLSMAVHHRSHYFSQQ